MKIPTLMVLVALAAFLLGGTLFSQTGAVQEEPTLKLLPQEKDFGASIKVPAVDESGQGVIATIGVDIRPGTGKILTSIDTILFVTDTQNSIRLARDVAQDITGFDLSRHDIVYTITADAAVIEGPSAGAALAIATIAALNEQKLRQDVMITGTVRRDGTIGRVGNVQEKARAAQNAGASLFLAPAQGGFPEIQEYMRTVTCQTINGVDFCKTEYIKSPATEMNVIEVSTVSEALSYFTGGGE